MLLARVLGPVVASAHHPAFDAKTLLLVQPVDEHGQAIGNQIIAVDHAQAGKGDLVLVLREGNGVRQILQQKNAPIRSLIAAVVDTVEAAS